MLAVPFVLKSSAGDRLCLALSKACCRLGRQDSVSSYCSACMFEDNAISLFRYFVVEPFSFEVNELFLFFTVYGSVLVSR